MSSHLLRLDGWQPATLNVLMRCHWRKRARLRLVDDQVVALEALAQGIPKAAGPRRVTVTWILGPRQRGFDPDGGGLKSLLDGLVNAGLLLDDRRQCLDLQPVQYERGARKGTRVLLEDLDSPPPSPTRGIGRPPTPPALGSLAGVLLSTCG